MGLLRARPILDRVASPDLHFLGHSTVRVELAGRTVLTDPLLAAPSGRCAASSRCPTRAAWAGVDLVLISHLHGDHLHLPSLRCSGRDAGSSSRAAPARGCAAAASPRSTSWPPARPSPTAS